MSGSVAIALLAIAVSAVGLLGGGSLLSVAAPHEPPPRRLTSRWSYSSTVESGSTLVDRGVLATEQYFLKVDLVFPFVYGAALLTSMLLLWASLDRPFSPAIVVALVGVAMLADWTENLVQLREIAPFLDSGDPAVQAARSAVISVPTIAKWAAVGGSVVTVVTMAISLICRSVR